MQSFQSQKRLHPASSECYLAIGVMMMVCYAADSRNDQKTQYNAPVVLPGYNTFVMSLSIHSVRRQCLFLPDTSPFPTPTRGIKRQCNVRNPSCHPYPLRLSDGRTCKRKEIQKEPTAIGLLARHSLRKPTFEPSLHALQTTQVKSPRTSKSPKSQGSRDSSLDWSRLPGTAHS